MTRQERSRKGWTRWRKLVSEQRRSGHTVGAFCRERGLCAPHFFWWKKRLREAAETKFVEVKLPLPGPIPPGTVGDSRVDVRLGNGRSLLVGPGFDAELVRALLAVVESEA